MALPNFQYHQPETLQDACQLHQTYGKTALLLAGGTDLIVKLRNRELHPEHVISLNNLDALSQIIETKTTVSIGSMCTITQLAESQTICKYFPALAKAANELASPSIRNMGTIGGNIVTASPAADLPPVLIAYGTVAKLRSINAERKMKLESLFKAPGKTNMRNYEILVDLEMEKPSKHAGSDFFKLGNRNALQIAVINGASYMTINSQTGCIENARIVLGAVAPTPIRCRSAERALIGKLPDQNLFLEAGGNAASDSQPINDLRGSADYRKDMAGVITARTLESAWNQIRSEKELT